MKAGKQTSARVVKIWLDISLALGGLFWCFLLLWLLLSPLVMSHSSTSADGVVQVAIGSGSLRPILSLNGTGSGTARVDSLRIIDGRGELRFKTTSWWLHFVGAVTILVGTLAVLFVIYILRKIIETVTAGRPFTTVNVRRIRLIGFLLLAGGVVVPLVEYLVARIILSQIISEGIPLSPPFDVNGGVILGGLLILVLATVFEYGSRLEIDQSLTI